MTAVPDRPRARALLVGTFHFHDAGLDAYKPQHAVDILSPERQQQLDDLTERLARFGPAKIAVEVRPERQDEIDAEYLAYKSGQFTPTAGEIHQLAFRLARRLGHDRVWCVDAWGRYYDPPIDQEEHASARTARELGEYVQQAFNFDPQRDLQAYASEHGQERLVEEWQARLGEFGRDIDRKKGQETLQETLLRLNDEENLLRSHGLYLTGWFEIGTGKQYPGVDYVTAWYNRNLRIFANIQRIKSADDRILVLIGAGHAPILRHCFQASPEYELVELRDYLA